MSAVAWCVVARAAPIVEFLHPAGGQQGATVTVTAGGKFDVWPVQVWTDSPGLKAKAGDAKGALLFEVGKDVAPGPHLVRVYDATGPAAPRVFTVGVVRELAEAEPNDELVKAQAVELPLVVNGRLEKSGDVDSYAVKLEAGQTLAAEVVGRRAGAPMDPMLHLFDPSGNQISFEHDGAGLDPVLVYRAARAGTFVVRVSAFAHPPAADVKLTGGAACVYRLTLRNQPPTRYAMPSGVRRGSKARVGLFAWGVAPDATPQWLDVDATGAAATDEWLPAGDGIRLALDDAAEMTEADAKSAPLAPPVAITGRIGADDEEDVYSFAARKDQRLVISAHAVALASPLDTVVRLEDEAGKTVAEDDDRGGGSDARLEWAAPADGTYRAVVGDRYRAGGPEYVYRLTIRPAEAVGVTGTLDADAYRVEPGKTATVKVTVARGGGAPGGLVAVATELPAGVTCTAAQVPEKGGEVTLTLAAAPDAKPAAGPIRVVLLSTDVAKPAAFAAACNLRKDGGQELIGRTETVWLTVPVAPSPPAAADKK